MKMTRTIKSTLVLFLAVFMFVVSIPMDAFAAEVNDNDVQVETEATQNEIQPRVSYSIIYPDQTVLHAGFKMRKLDYIVKYNNTNKFVLLRLTNRSNPNQYYTYSLAGTTGTYNINVEAGVYDISVVGGSNTNYGNIQLGFHEN